ncbi:MAG: FIST C-terminal domain-containing protein [Proteobacteria bacterium]|nr:FIST C-terminal domain-containing protein [Pseudomonadota bacterium]
MTALIAQTRQGGHDAIVKQRMLHLLLENPSPLFGKVAAHASARLPIGVRMKAQCLTWRAERGWSAPSPDVAGAQVVLLFAARESLEGNSCHTQLKQLFHDSYVIGGSTGGQIVATDVTDDEAIALALRFEHTKVRSASEKIQDAAQSRDVGERLARSLAAPDLKCIFVVSDGLLVNGSALIEGLRIPVGNEVIITGGLAGDGAAFEKTIVVAGDIAASGQVAAIGFYGNDILIGNGCAGGWDKFGPRRTITSAQGNMLLSLDGKPALELYKQYLGEEAAGLPGTALLYPLMIIDPDSPDHTLVRTVLGVDHEQKTMTFAGDIPNGWSAQLMRGHFDNLCAGAAQAAATATLGGEAMTSDVAAIMISCVGRRLLMGDNIVDEVEAATSALGHRTHAAGFYSYGEISPHPKSGLCELHNQTMTITTISEAA